ncbi:MAG: 30S ribosomal protein S13 [Candidatus Eisenbacteria bacterium]|nr:30S ribosomal protein S13 [Candidatus Eisenbacteria bacterium]
MARIAGVDLPNNKKIAIALTYIYGIGDTTARRIIDATQVDGTKRVHELTDEEAARLRNEIENKYRVEGTLHTEMGMNVKRLMDIGCYRGMRHRRSLPAHGQRTHTNARTRKGPRKGAPVVKKPRPGKKG